MSVGNLRDQGNKGNNFPYQLANLQLLGSLNDCCTTSGGTLLSILAALQNGQNFTQNLVEDLGGVGCPTNCPVYLEIKIWNGTSFDPPVYYDADGNIVTPVGPLKYLNPTFVLEQILTQVTAINSDLDVPLSTRNAEATQLLIKNILNASLDVPLSTRLADATFTARINTLGQKTSAQSTPVVLPSDQVVNVNIGANPMVADAFGRQRVSNPMTLFDSSHRYHDNGLWNTSTSTGGTAVFSINEGLVNLNVTGAAGSEVLRETTKVFSYQPGKSMLVLNTFVLESAKPNLRQRVGYFGTDNGFYLQLDGSVLSFVERSLVTGSVTETRISRLGGVYGPGDTGWNVDKLNGSGPSGVTLDITKAQIMFMDIEWLGEGTVRLGFIIDGNFILCHKFNHANLITTTYITTASLPLRCEITNTGITGSSSTLKQVCSTVISEGGYELRGTQQAVGIPITTPRTFAVAGTYYPIAGLRLISTNLDAIVIATAISILGLGNGKNYAWRVIQGATITGGAWVSAGVNSSVEYNLTGTSSAGGRILAQGFVNSSNQASPSINILKEALFTNQLERNSFTGVAYELVIEAAIDTTGGVLGMYASIDWEEISR